MSPATPSQPGPSELHVVHVVPRDVALRLGRAVRELAAAVRPLGVQVTFVSDEPTLLAACADGPAQTRRIAPPRGWPRGWRPRQLARLELAPVDLVHVWGLAALEAARQWAAAISRPLLVVLTGWKDLDDYGRSSPDPATPVAAVSRNLAEALEASGVARPAAIVPPVTAEDPPPDPLPRDRIAGIACIGVGGDAAGLLIQAFVRLRENQRDFHAVLLTSGSDRALWRQVREARLAHYVSVLDRSELLEPAALGADILIVPQRQRQVTVWPLVAMARRSLVLAPREQPAEWFIEDQTYAGFDTADPSELTLLLTRALGQHPDLMQLANRAAEYVRQHHDPPGIAEQLVSVYRSLTGRAPAGGAAS